MNTPSDIQDEYSDSFEFTMRLAESTSVWRRMLNDAPSVWSAFLDYANLVAIDIGLTQQSRGSVVASGVPSAWLRMDGACVPFIPDVTGPSSLAGRLWRIGVDIKPLTMTAGLDALYDPGVATLSMMVFRDMIVMRDQDRLDAMAAEWSFNTGDIRAINRSFYGCCETAHEEAAKRKRIRALAQDYAEILSLETGVDATAGETRFPPRLRAV